MLCRSLLQHTCDLESAAVAIAVVVVAAVAVAAATGEGDADDAAIDPRVSLEIEPPIAVLESPKSPTDRS